MIDKDWLEDAINQQAKDKFETMFGGLPPQLSSNDNVRIAYQALLRSKEYEKLKELSIPVIKKQITNEILENLRGVKKLFDRGDE